MIHPRPPGWPWPDRQTTLATIDSFDRAAVNHPPRRAMPWPGVHAHERNIWIHIVAFCDQSPSLRMHCYKMNCRPSKSIN
ncbi:hypothetical protein [Azospirillum argentinense]